MEVWIRGVPKHCTERDLRKSFRGPLAEYEITVFFCKKSRNKECATIAFLDTDKGERFLAKYGIRGRRQIPICQIIMKGKPVICEYSKFEPLDLLLRSLADEAAGLDGFARSHLDSDHDWDLSTFAFAGLRCGTWSYSEQEQLTFESHFLQPRSGRVIFGHHQAALLSYSNRRDSPHEPTNRIDILYSDLDTVTVGNCQSPTITFALNCAPRFYRVGPVTDFAATANLITQDVENMIAQVEIANSDAVQLIARDTPESAFAGPKVRVTSINPAHTTVAASCFAYQVRLSNHHQLAEVLHLLQSRSYINSVISCDTLASTPHTNLRISFEELNYVLASHITSGALSFGITFQLLRLARNGVLFPRKVMKMIPKVVELRQMHDDKAVVHAIRRLYESLLVIGPHTQAHSYSYNAVVERLQNYATEFPSELVTRHAHIVFVHKLTVTPAGVYFEGPEPEKSNRVLRDYAGYSDYFLRVTFSDEDDDPIRHDPIAAQREIFHRFKEFMNASYNIAGREFSFLGFSHSSLRSRSCWFMAPFQFHDKLMFSPVVIRSLGDFSHIGSPARCAARIGQAFSDTTSTVVVDAGMLSHMPDVERNGRCFSDGCGTISLSLLRKVWRVYGVRCPVKPTVLQIRYAGAKGIVSLDSELEGDQFKIRPSMEKFTGSNATNLEVCNAAWRSRTTVLNRGFIKVLEDLGVPLAAFMDLQNRAVENLRSTTASTINSAIFLREAHTSKAAGLPTLLETIADVGLEYYNDSFLRGVVEMAVITKLREIKYRGRIPVEKGVKLHGIMDETGYLKENEIYVVVKNSPEEKKKVYTGNNVVVARSPILHPGDVRVVQAVNIPPDSPLKDLHNCVVFSQHGTRDLPSQLSGGDLDGDDFDIIFDPTLVPTREMHPPADYPRAQGVELGREVNMEDMSNFFIEFMQSDRVGELSIKHLQLADQEDLGVFHPDCIKLAEMASTAVDFSKTGIPVDMSQCPKVHRFKPDFMAPDPRVIITNGLASFVDDYEEEDDPIKQLDDRQPMRYYQSYKALGHLYREIDEHQFLGTMQRRNRALVPERENTVLPDLWRYIERCTMTIQWGHQLDLARRIKDTYEQKLVQTLYQYAPSPHQPVTETELFSGTILGKSNRQSKRMRQATYDMREQFEEVLQFTISSIVDGEDDGADRDLEALPRAIACLALGMREQPVLDARIGELHSWKYVAVGVCLAELKKWFSVRGRYALPDVHAS